MSVLTASIISYDNLTISRFNFSHTLSIQGLLKCFSGSWSIINSKVWKVWINSKNVLTARILIRSYSFWRTGQVEDDQLGFMGLGYNHLVEFDGRMHSTNVRGFPTWQRLTRLRAQKRIYIFIRIFYVCIFKKNFRSKILIHFFLIFSFKSK